MGAAPGGQDPKNVAELTNYIQSMLQQMQDRFQTMSDQIISRIDDMGGRIDDLEQNINDLMIQAQAGHELQAIEHLEQEREEPKLEKSGKNKDILHRDHPTL